MGRDAADVVVIGGGVIGTSVAYHLAKSGRRVCIIERDGPASGASGANVGLVVLGNKPPGIRLTLCWESAKAYANLSEELGMDIEYDRCGGLTVFAHKEEAVGGQQLFEIQQRAALPTELISPEEVRLREPTLVAATLGAIYCPLDGYVNPFRVTYGYAIAARRLGATFIQGSRVTGIEVRHGRVQAVVHDGGKVLTEAVVNAAGAWSPHIGRLVGLDIPVTPSRGQVLITPRTARYPGLVVLGIEPNARQVAAGGILIGSTAEFVGYDRRVTYETVTEFAREAVAAFPFLRSLSLLRCWAGLRPGSPDDLPILGPAGQVDGFFLATAHDRRGVAMAPATGRVVAEMVNGQAPFIPIEECSFARFSREVKPVGEVR